MKPEHTIALAAAIKSAEQKAARACLRPGTYNVDMTVHVSGEIRVGADGERTPTASIPVKDVMAFFLARAGATREASIKLIQECVSECLSANKPARLPEVDEAYQAAVEEMTKALPKARVAGKVTSKLSVNEVSEQTLTLKQAI